MRILLGSISVLPTHVGVIPPPIELVKSILRTTHTRGGDPGYELESLTHQEYYPHTWG